MKSPPKIPQIWDFDCPMAFFPPVVVALRKYQELSRLDTRIDVMNHFFVIASYDFIFYLICISTMHATGVKSLGNDY